MRLPKYVCVYLYIYICIYLHTYIYIYIYMVYSPIHQPGLQKWILRLRQVEASPPASTCATVMPLATHHPRIKNPHMFIRVGWDCTKNPSIFDGWWWWFMTLLYIPILKEITDPTNAKKKPKKKLQKSEIPPLRWLLGQGLKRTPNSPSSESFFAQALAMKVFELTGKVAAVAPLFWKLPGISGANPANPV